MSQIVGNRQYSNMSASYVAIITIKTINISMFKRSPKHRIGIITEVPLLSEPLMSMGPRMSPAHLGRHFTSK